jgi:hypoxanthine phosphoribosyltransferase
MWTREGPYELDWATLGTMLACIVADIRADGFAPSVIIGVARGGLVPAGHLACALDIPTVRTVRARRTSTDDQYSPKQPPQLDSALSGIGPGASVLIVDDIVGTGATAEMVHDHVLASGVAEADTRFAALVRNHRASFRPDYCPGIADDWIIFPWEAGWGATPGARPFVLQDHGR